MKPKKSSKANIEKKRIIFLEIGIILALLLVWGMFEWSQPIKEVKSISMSMEQLNEEDVIITHVEEKKTPPPPPPAEKKQIIIDIIQITSDNIDNDIINVDTETDIDEDIKIIEPKQKKENIEEQDVFIRVEKMPEYPGGVKMLLKYLSKNINYPQLAVENGIQGKVYLKFVVEKDGSIGDIEVLRSPDKLLEREAVRVVKNLPNFTPGMQRNKPVRVWFQIPVTFQLQS